MLAVVLALMPALGYGCSDFAAGLASRTASVIQVTLPACVAVAGLARGLRGVTAAAGTIFYFSATHHGLLAVVAVLTSLYPASTIVLARVMLGERLTRLRLAGLVLARACVALIAAGGAG